MCTVPNILGSNLTYEILYWAKTFFFHNKNNTCFSKT